MAFLVYLVIVFVLLPPFIPCLHLLTSPPSHEITFIAHVVYLEQ